MAAHGLPEAAFEIVVIKTAGDRILDRPLSEVGGKGLFTKEIEEALLNADVDLAVHSMKDMQTVLPDGLVVAATLPREDVRDAFVSLRHRSLADLPAGARIGTSSLRRRAQMLHKRPDLEVVEFRGNVHTRLRKLEDGIADATLLACAGLNRLGLADRVTQQIATSDMLPAVAQGAIGIEIRSKDEHRARLVAPINDAATAVCVTAERAFLARLQGSCRTPIAGLAELSAGTLTMRGAVLSTDGRTCLTTTESGTPGEATRVGLAAAQSILDRGGARLLASAR
jgi:hydroxymethylbilane synthase